MKYESWENMWTKFTGEFKWESEERGLNFISKQRTAGYLGFFKKLHLKNTHKKTYTIGEGWKNTQRQQELSGAA